MNSGEIKPNDNNIFVYMYGEIYRVVFLFVHGIFIRSERDNFQRSTGPLSRASVIIIFAVYTMSRALACLSSTGPVNVDSIPTTLAPSFESLSISRAKQRWRAGNGFTGVQRDTHFSFYRYERIGR